MTLPALDHGLAMRAVESLRLTIKDLGLYLPEPQRYMLEERARVGLADIKRSLHDKQHQLTWSHVVLCLARRFPFTEDLRAELAELGEPAHVRAVRDLLEDHDLARARAATYAKIARAATAFVLAKEGSDTLEAWDELCTAVAGQTLADLQD